MNIDHCVFKILGKKNNKASQTNGKQTMENVKTVYPTMNKVCGVGVEVGMGVGRYKSILFQAMIDIITYRTMFLKCCSMKWGPQRSSVFMVWV